VPPRVVARAFLAPTDDEPVAIGAALWVARELGAVAERHRGSQA
jgi:hypothetical protein